MMLTGYFVQRKNVTYISDGINEISFSKNMKNEDMHAAQAWKMMDARPFDDPGFIVEGKASI